MAPRRGYGESAHCGADVTGSPSISGLFGGPGQEIPCLRENIPGVQQVFQQIQNPRVFLNFPHSIHASLLFQAGNLDSQGQKHNYLFALAYSFRITTATLLQKCEYS